HTFHHALMVARPVAPILRIAKREAVAVVANLGGARWRRRSLGCRRPRLGVGREQHLCTDKTAAERQRARDYIGAYLEHLVHGPHSRIPGHSNKVPQRNGKSPEPAQRRPSAAKSWMERANRALAAEARRP